MAFTRCAHHIDINWMHMAYAQTDLEVFVEKLLNRSDPERLGPRAAGPRAAGPRAAGPRAAAERLPSGWTPSGWTPSGCDPDCFRCESVSFGEGLQTTAVNIFKPLRPLASLLESELMGFQDPVHRAMRPLLLLLLLWASLPRWRLQPPVLPDVAQQLAQTGFDPDHRPGLLEVLDRFLRTDRYAPSDEW